MTVPAGMALPVSLPIVILVIAEVTANREEYVPL